MDDLRVENYDAKEVDAKKQSISRRVAVASSAVAFTLGLFSLVGCEPPSPHVQDPPIVAGGAGSWFHSYWEYDEYAEEDTWFCSNEDNEPDDQSEEQIHTRRNPKAEYTEGE